MENNTRVNTWQPASKTENYIRKYKKYKEKAARRARLTETKEKQKIPQAQPLVAEQLQQRQLALLQPRQEQEQAEQEGQP